MNATILGLELKRQMREFLGLFFIIILPGFFYLIFGAAMEWSDAPAGNGNVAMQTMISMAAYGAVVATTSIGGAAAVERMQGWGRQLGLTPLRDRSYVLTKTVLGVMIAALPIALIYTLGGFTGAQGTASAWVLSAVIALLGAGVFALWGLVFGLAIRTESAIGVASGSLVVLAFLGNMFFPLGGTLLTIAKFTPLYGYVSLARYPLSEGAVMDGIEGALIQEPLWVPLLNMGAWTVLLAVLASLLVRRGRSRQ